VWGSERRDHGPGVVVEVFGLPYLRLEIIPRVLGGVVDKPARWEDDPVVCSMGVFLEITREWYLRMRCLVWWEHPFLPRARIVQPRKKFMPEQADPEC